MNLERFNSREELETAWIVYTMIVNGCDKEVAKVMASGQLHYSPVYYRGGWVIPGFGYSVERIGVHITAEHAGNPEFVGSKELIQ